MLEEYLGSANSVKGNLVDTSPSLSPHNLLNMTPKKQSCSQSYPTTSFLLKPWIWKPEKLHDSSHPSIKYCRYWCEKPSMSSTTRPIIINPRTSLQPVSVMESYPNFRSHNPPFSPPCLWFAVLGNGISLNKVAVSHIFR